MSTTEAPVAAVYSTPHSIRPALLDALAARLVADVMDAVDEASIEHPDVRIDVRVAEAPAGTMLAVEFSNDAYTDTCRMFPSGLPRSVIRRDILWQARSMDPAA